MLCFVSKRSRSLAGRPSAKESSIPTHRPSHILVLSVNFRLQQLLSAREAPFLPPRSSHVYPASIPAGGVSVSGTQAINSSKTSPSKPNYLPSSALAHRQAAADWRNLGRYVISYLGASSFFVDFPSIPRRGGPP